MGEIEDYFLDEKKIKESVAEGLDKTIVKKNNDNCTIIDKEVKQTKKEQTSPSSIKTEGKKHPTTEIPSSDFESIFKVSNDIPLSHLIRISSTTATQLQRILFAKQLQGQKIPLSSLVENILNEYLREKERDIRALEKTLFIK